MRISLEWLNEYTDITDLTTEEIVHALTMSGLEVEEIEKTGPKFTNIITAKIKASFNLFLTILWLPLARYFDISGIKAIDIAAIKNEGIVRVETAKALYEPYSKRIYSGV